MTTVVESKCDVKKGARIFMPVDSNMQFTDWKKISF
jgi:hypothetical protein